MIKRLLLTLFCPVLLLSSANAQSPNYSIIHYTTDHGLPQNSVKSIAFDQAGFCWLATEMGLVRFDGRSFKVFNSINIAGCHAERIALIASDITGQLYAKNETGQEFFIETHRGMKAPAPHLLNSNATPHVAEGYAIHDRALPKKISAWKEMLKLINIPGNGVYGYTTDSLYYITGDSLIAIHRPPTENNFTFLCTGSLLLWFDSNRPVTAWKHGRVLPGFKGIQGPLQLNSSYRQGRFTCYSNKGQSFIYAGKTLYGIYEQDGAVTSKLLLDNLDIPVLFSVYYMADQRKYYIGSLVSGLYLVSLSDFSYPAQTADAQEEGFYNQVLTSEGDIICQRYLYRKNGGPVKLKMNGYVGASLYLENRKLYYGGSAELFRYDLATSHNKKLFTLDSRPSSIYRDKTDSNVTIVATSSSLGKTVNDSLRVLKPIPVTPLSIMTTVQTGKDSFLIATKTGLKWYAFASNSVYRAVLDSVYIRSVYPEPNGRIWISTYNKGFYLYENGRVFTLPVQNFPALRTIHCFVDDGHGNFWLPTNDGLFTVTKKDLLAYTKNPKHNVYYYMYSVYDNLRTNEFNGGCTPPYLWMPDSMLSLPSIAGLVQFYPHQVNKLVPDKGIYIEEIKLMDSVIDLPSTKKMVLGPDYGRLSITVSTPYFGDGKNLDLVYKIHEHDKMWQPVPANGMILLDGVAPGTYEIAVALRNGDQRNTGTRLPFTIQIDPWFYNTWWFYGLLSVFVIVCVVILAIVRVRMLKKRNANLQAIIHSQTEDLRQSNRTKDNVITMVLHDLRSPISFLDLISDQLVKQHRQMNAGQLEDTLKALKNSTASLNNFTEQFFAWAASQHRHFKVTYETFPLQQLFTTLHELYADIAATNKNELHIRPTDIVINTDRNILSIVLRNLLDNANKNTNVGSIDVNATIRDEEIILSVIDTGAGLSQEAMEAWLNSNKTTGLHGNGSLIVLNLLQKIGGTLQIQPGENGGTIFQIMLPRY